MLFYLKRPKKYYPDEQTEYSIFDTRYPIPDNRIKKMRILSIDYGKKRIGIAVSDPLGITAQPVSVIETKKGYMDEIVALFDRYEISEVVVGMPFALSGEKGIAAEEVGKFIEALKARVSVPVFEMDERMTTAKTNRMLIEADVKRKNRKEVVDMLAAAQILTDYMQRKSMREHKHDE